MTSQWLKVLSPAEIDAYHALTATLDPAFAKREKEFYLSQTSDRLRVLAAQSWNANDSTGYQMARSYAARLG